MGLIGFEGCTPGFWRQPQHFDSWTDPFDPTDDFDATFGVDFFDPDRTLLEALTTGGGGLNALGRHAVAALLNAASPDVDYPLTVQEVIDMVQAVDPTDDDAVEALKDQFEEFNELGCPLN